MGLKILPHSEAQSEKRRQSEAINTIMLSFLGIPVATEDLARAQDTIVSASGIEVTAEQTGAWQPGEWVETGVERTDEGSDYVCLQAHCTQEAWEPKDTPELWEQK